jgi:hypothetical protein
MTEAPCFDDLIRRRFTSDSPYSRNRSTADTGQQAKARPSDITKALKIGRASVYRVLANGAQPITGGASMRTIGMASLPEHSCFEGFIRCGSVDN